MIPLALFKFQLQNKLENREKMILLPVFINFKFLCVLHKFKMQDTETYLTLRISLLKKSISTWV